MLEWMQHDAIDHTKDVTLTFLHWLLIIIYLLLKFWHSRRSRIHKQPPELFLQILQILSPVLESLFHKVASLQACNVTKNRLLHRCFPVKFEKFWRTSERLLLCIDYFIIYWFLQSSTVHVFHFFFITQLKQ